MKRLWLAWMVIFLLGSGMLGAQTIISNQQYENLLKTRKEVYFRIPDTTIQSHPGLLKRLGSFISIDRVDQDYVYAYASAKGFHRFLDLKIAYRLLQPPSMRLSPEKLKSAPLKTTQAWDYYPSYHQYLNLMSQFQTDYPQLCSLVNIGSTVDGRELLFVHIRSGKDSTLNKPQFMYTSTMHGDETTGYVLMLHLIDYLLSNYGKIPRVTDLIDSTDLWINPLANPDGTYAAGDTSVYGATRYNANGVDLNRNYPDPQAGPHPDNNTWQPETVAFMDFAAAHHLVMSCNMHGGNEVANYPWDTWSFPTADDVWWQYVCRQYADTVHVYGPSGYFTDENNGITDGFAWYQITGGRQDYMNFFEHDREFTLELSQNKMPDPSTLPEFWDYNYRSFLDYMHQVLDGFRGVVTDSLTGHPVKADVFLDGHDTLHSDVYSDSLTGAYFRPVKAGTYDLTFSAPGYVSKTLKNLTVRDGETVVADVRLRPPADGIPQTGTSGPPQAYPNPAFDRLQFRNLKGVATVRVYSLSGDPVLETTVTAATTLNVRYLPRGMYLLVISEKRNTYTQKLLLR